MAHGIFKSPDADNLKAYLAHKGLKHFAAYLFGIKKSGSVFIP
jgi:hypothetical protein